MPTPLFPVRAAAAISAGKSLTDSAKAWAEHFNFRSRSAVKAVQVPQGQAATTGPSSVQRTLAFYRAAEDTDLGAARLLKPTVGGKPLFALHMTTDGDEGFVELFSDKGTLLASGVTRLDANSKQVIDWDTKAGAVRERVAPKDRSASIEAFSTALDDAKQAQSPSGKTVNQVELRGATAHLVGADLTSASVDGFERTTLLRELAASPQSLTSAARADANRLAALYQEAKAATLSRFKKATLQGSDFLARSELASAQVSTAAAPARIKTMTALTLRAFDRLPTQVVPVTRADATRLLREAGASAAEAKSTLDSLTDAKGALFAGRLFEQGADWVPTATGLAVFGVSSNGRDVKALSVKALDDGPGPDAVPRQVIAQRLGVDREVQVLATRTTTVGQAFDLRWAPPMGGTLEATLSVPALADVEPSFSSVKLPPVREAALRASLEGRLANALGTPRDVLGWVGRDDAQGVAFVVAHRPPGQPLAAATVSTVRIAGETTATATPRPLTAQDDGLMRDLALVLARGAAEDMVAEPLVGDDARLEVALRTRWATAGDLERVDDDAPAGFDPATEVAQYQLSRVWGDNAVFVTFRKDGGARIDHS